MGALRRRASTAVVPLLVVLAAGAAAADPRGAAEQLFRDGQRLVKAGQYAEACTTFEGSQRLDPSLATLMNLANCREKNGQLATAWSLFLQVSSTARGDATFDAMSPVARDRAAALEPRLSYLVIEVPDPSRLDGLVITRDGEPVDPATWDHSIPVDGGRHAIEATAPGHEPWRTTIEVAGERDRRSVEVPRLRPSPPSAAPVVEVAVAPGRTGARRLGLGVAAGAAIVLGGALAVELAGRAAYRDYEDAPAGPAREDRYDTANTRHRVAQALAVTGVVGAGAAVYLLVRGRGPADRARTTALAPLLGGEVTGLVVRGGF